MFEGATFDEETVQLKPGDLVLVFSDGVTEAMNTSGDEFGDDRLIACFTSHRTKPLQPILDSLMADVRTFAGEALQNDDVTMLLLRYDGPPAPAIPAPADASRPARR